MALTFKFYTDSNLTAPLVGSLTFDQAADGSSGPAVKQLWFGSTTANRKVEAASDPGVDQVFIDIVDAASGSGEPDTAVKLALTLGGLSGAVAGASLNLGTSVLSGVANAKSVYVQVTDATAAVGNYTDLSLETNTINESSTV